MLNVDQNVNSFCSTLEIQMMNAQTESVGFVDDGMNLWVKRLAVVNVTVASHLQQESLLKMENQLQCFN